MVNCRRRKGRCWFGCLADIAFEEQAGRLAAIVACTLPSSIGTIMYCRAWKCYQWFFFLANIALHRAALETDPKWSFGTILDLFWSIWDLVGVQSDHFGQFWTSVWSILGLILDKFRTYLRFNNKNQKC